MQVIVHLLTKGKLMSLNHSWEITCHNQSLITLAISLKFCIKKGKYIYFIYILFPVNYAVLLLAIIFSILAPTLVLGTIFIDKTFDFDWMVLDISTTSCFYFSFISML